MFDYSGFLSPACFKALFSVPGGTSMLGLPGTVTVPGSIDDEIVDDYP
jgi:hypothetical protein